jgi:hypothetical protein
MLQSPPDDRTTVKKSALADADDRRARFGFPAQWLKAGDR